MSTQVQLRRGTAAQHATFVGAPGEITVVTDDNTLRVHDGVTPGGHEVSDADLRQAFDAHLAEKVTDVGGVHGLVCEEGNWTPTLYGATTTGSNTYSQQIGRYVRIGNLVNVQFRVLLSLKDPSMSGAARIGGLPFINDQILAANAYISNIALGSGRTGLHLVPPAGANFIQLTQTGAGLPGAFLDSSAIVDNSEITGNFSYKIRV